MFQTSDHQNTSPSGSAETVQPIKFGTFLGVFIPSILTILGVIMYLRMGWIVGNVGLPATIAIVVLSSLVTFLTSLSISATATNMTVRTGGAYYMISRSFGVEAGSAIGLPLFLAQAVGISFYVYGFAESLSHFYPGIPVYLIGLGALATLALIAYYSPNLALRTQLVIFIIIFLSLVSFMLGGPVESRAPQSMALFDKAGFWAVFAIFFPAVTGILSGVSMSGDLRDPGKSIPVGTIAAVVVGVIVYLMVPIFLYRFATKEQLLADNLIMEKVALFGPIIYLGIWGATLSSALGSLLAAPRTLQALASDRIVPQILGRGFGPSRDPRIATVLTFIIAAIGIYFGSLDLIAPVLTMFFLTSYGFLNIAAGLETLVANPSWRPRFKVHWSLSFVGGFLCFAIMMLINAGAAFVAFFACGLIYLLVKRRNLNANWTDARRGILLHFVRYCVYKMASLTETGRTWRPNLLVLSGSPTSRWHLIALADAISHGKGFLTVCSIIQDKDFPREKLPGLETSMRTFLNRKHVPALTKVKAVDDFVDGVTSLIRDYGIGAITPNTIVFGEPDQVEKYVDFCSIILNTMQAERNILVVRDPVLSESVEASWQSKAGNKKIIDIWWGKNSRNSLLMLVMAYMLQTSPEWQGSTLRVRSLVRDEDERRGIMENLEFLADTSRINVIVDVLVRSEEEEALRQIHRHSKDTDLVFIGMLPPKPEESAEDYAIYFEGLMELTKDFPPLVVTLAGEKLHLESVFQ